MDLNIRGRRALITGADSGIGWETARLLIEEGVSLVISDIDQEALEESAANLPAGAGTVTAIAADVRDEESVAELRDRALAALGGLDILVHSAGITGAQGSFADIDLAGWQETLDVDLLGPVRVTRAFLPQLRSGGWGRLVFLASEDAVQPYADELPYCAAKAGILALAKGLSRSYAGEGLLVNAVSPAFIATPMTDAMMAKRARERGTDVTEAISSFLAEERPYLELGRRGEPREVAAAIAFLCSDAASFVNGSNYRVDGGSVATL